MSKRNNTKGSKSFPWKAVFGAISIIGVLVFLGSSNNSNTIKGDSSETGQSSLSGFSLRD